jgi:hypothetical protein
LDNWLGWSSLFEAAIFGWWSEHKLNFWWELWIEMRRQNPIQDGASCQKGIMKSAQAISFAAFLIIFGIQEIR